MEKIVRITRVEEQDETRRDDMRKMSPASRMEALLSLREQLYPYAGLERVATVRSLLAAKRESGRPKDRIDVEELIRVRWKSKRPDRL